MSIEWWCNTWNSKIIPAIPRLLRFQCFSLPSQGGDDDHHDREAIEIEECQQPEPIDSLYGRFTYIYHKDQPNVGKYTIQSYIF